MSKRNLNEPFGRRFAFLVTRAMNTCIMNSSPNTSSSNFLFSLHNEHDISFGKERWPANLSCKNRMVNNAGLVFPFPHYLFFADASYSIMNAPFKTYL